MSRNLKNKSGKEYEDRVESILIKNNFKYKTQQYFGTTLFGKRMRPDFIIEYHDYIVTVECKHQITRGSAEEKIFYTAHSIVNLHTQFSDVVPFLIMSGGGWSTHCIQFMKEWAKTEPIIITTVNGLIKELENGLPTWDERQPYTKRYLTA